MNIPSRSRSWDISPIPASMISGSFDFRDGASITAEYLYDANGNMTKDANKGITQIQYNHLNLPSRIAMVKGSSTSTIDYVYSASGAKLRVIHRPNVLSPLSTTTDYVNGYIFTNAGRRDLSVPQEFRCA